MAVTEAARLTRTETTTELSRRYREETMLGIVWHDFRRHPMALVGISFLRRIVLLSVFAFLSPYDPESVDVANRFSPPSWELRSVPTAAGVMLRRGSSTGARVTDGRRGGGDHGGDPRVDWWARPPASTAGSWTTR